MNTIVSLLLIAASIFVSNYVLSWDTNYNCESFKNDTSHSLYHGRRLATQSDMQQISDYIYNKQWVSALMLCDQLVFVRMMPEFRVVETIYAINAINVNNSRNVYYEYQHFMKYYIGENVFPISRVLALEFTTIDNLHLSLSTGNLLAFVTLELIRSAHAFYPDTAYADKINVIQMVLLDSTEMVEYFGISFDYSELSQFPNFKPTLHQAYAELKTHPTYGIKKRNLQILLDSKLDFFDISILANKLYIEKSIIEFLKNRYDMTDIYYDSIIRELSTRIVPDKKLMNYPLYVW
jgi:hypothetical protein